MPWKIYDHDQSNKRYERYLIVVELIVESNETKDLLNVWSNGVMRGENEWMLIISLFGGIRSVFKDFLPFFFHLVLLLILCRSLTIWCIKKRKWWKFQHWGEKDTGGTGGVWLQAEFLDHFGNTSDNRNMAISFKLRAAAQRYAKTPEPRQDINHMYSTGPFYLSLFTLFICQRPFVLIIMAVHLYRRQ